MDIRTIADLLQEFVKAERDFLNKQDIRHPTTIGSMYEGLTEAVLNKSVFQGLNLKVAKNSFIEGCVTEFDILLVEGEGQPIPYTSRFKFKPSQVIAIIQVKKNLYSKDIEEGYNNFKFLIDKFKPESVEPFVTRIFRNAFRGICRKDLSSKRSGELTENEDFIFSSLRLDAYLPLRIVWGYNGFTSEYRLRESFIEYLEQNITTDMNQQIGGFNPTSFPNLVICDKFTLIKLNGMPFGTPIVKDDWWHFFASSSYNPAYFLLELVWTRLQHRFKLPSNIFEDDMRTEQLAYYIDFKIMKVNSRFGWNVRYHTMSKEALKKRHDAVQWTPTELDKIQFTIVEELCEKGKIDLNDKTLESFVLTGSYLSLGDFVTKLKDTGLVYVEKNALKLLTDECLCAIINGKFLASENKSGRFANWIKIEASKARPNGKAQDHGKVV